MKILNYEQFLDSLDPEELAEHNRAMKEMEELGKQAGLDYIIDYNLAKKTRPDLTFRDYAKERWEQSLKE